MILKIDEFTNQFVEAMYPGTYLVEFFPWMLYIPSAIAGWKRRAEEGFLELSVMFKQMFLEAEKQAVSAPFVLLG
jgi:hypothetical protein